MQANKSCDITLYENISLNGKIGMNLQNIYTDSGVDTFHDKVYIDIYHLAITHFIIQC